MRAPLEAETDFAALLLFQPTALSVRLTRWTDGLAPFHVDLELFGGKSTLIVLGGMRRRTHQPSAFAGRFG